MTMIICALVCLAVCVLAENVDSLVTDQAMIEDMLDLSQTLKSPGAVLQHPNLLKSSTHLWEEYRDDDEDIGKTNTAKNSMGVEKINGFRDLDPKKLKKHGYVSTDAYFGPKGHYYLGGRRRRIGAGFGRRRRTSHMSLMPCKYLPKLRKRGILKGEFKFPERCVKAKAKASTAKETALKEKSLKTKEKALKASERECKVKQSQVTKAAEHSAKESMKLISHKRMKKEICYKKKAAKKKVEREQKLLNVRSPTFKWNSRPCHAKPMGKDADFKLKMPVKGKRVNVGIVPAGMVNVKVELNTDKDLDVELWSKDGKVAVIAWGCKDLDQNAKKDKYYKEFKNCLDTPSMKVRKFADLTVEYTGWDGLPGKDFTQDYGHEYMHFVGKTKIPLMIKAFSYASGWAQVWYSWGRDVKRCMKLQEKVRREKHAKFEKQWALVHRKQGKMKEMTYKSILKEVNFRKLSCSAATKQIQAEEKALTNAKHLLRKHKDAHKACSKRYASQKAKYTRLLKRRSGMAKRLKMPLRQLKMPKGTGLRVRKMPHKYGQYGVHGVMRINVPKGWFRKELAMKMQHNIEAKKRMASAIHAHKKMTEIKTKAFKLALAIKKERDAAKERDSKKAPLKRTQRKEERHGKLKHRKKSMKAWRAAAGGKEHHLKAHRRAAAVLYGEKKHKNSLRNKYASQEATYKRYAKPTQDMLTNHPHHVVAVGRHGVQIRIPKQSKIKTVNREVFSPLTKRFVRYVGALAKKKERDVKKVRKSKGNPAMPNIGSTHGDKGDTQSTAAKASKKTKGAKATKHSHAKTKKTKMKLPWV